MEEELQGFERKKNLHTKTSMLQASDMKEFKENTKYRNKLPKFY